VGHRLVVFPAVARGRRLGAGQCGAARASAAAGRAPTDAERGHSRQPVGQDDGKGGPRGYDAGKHVTGRKRQLLVDTEGFVVKARVHPANETEATGGQALLVALAGRLPRLALIWVDGGYKRAFAEWVTTELGWRVEVVQHDDAGRRHGWLPAEAP